MSYIDNCCINALRVVGAEMITKAKSGHPGIVLGAAPIVHTLFTKHICISSNDEKWFNRDRFVLSAGHGSTLLYMMLHLSGYGITMDDLKNLRQKGAMTPGHPEYGHTPGVEITTGPLGQGIASAVGMAIVENYLSAKFNKPDFNVIDHYTYVLCGDGDLQEGVAQEAMSLAGHLGLNKLIILYDSNDIQLDGEVQQANTENTKMKVEAMGFEYIRVDDGNDVDSLDKAISNAKLSNKPTLIEIKTIIGYGAPNSGESSIHGKPMPVEDVKELRKFLAYNEPEFTFSDDVRKYYEDNVKTRGYNACSEWNHILSTYANKYPEDYQEFQKFIFDDFEIEDLNGIPTWEVGSSESTRKEMGAILDWLSTKLPNIIGGSADLTASTMVKGADGIYGQSNPLGRNIKFGVREHAMAAITNGITLHGGMRGFCSGFFVFSDYLKPAVRLAAIMGLPSLFFFSHDTVCVGEDGPTHQPVEQLAMFRCMPNTNLIRPADSKEMTAAMLLAFSHDNTYPTIVTSSRQALPNLAETDQDKVKFGAYIAFEAKKNADYAFISCGSELNLCIDAAKKLKAQGIDVNVVSMPSMFLFEKQSNEYKNSILPKGQKRMAVEMGTSMPWYKYASYVKGINEYGKSMPIKYIFDEYGFTVDKICNEFLENVR